MTREVRMPLLSTNELFTDRVTDWTNISKVKVDMRTLFDESLKINRISNNRISSLLKLERRNELQGYSEQDDLRVTELLS